MTGAGSFHGKRWLPQSALALASTAIALGAAEAALRLVGYGPPAGLMRIANTKGSDVRAGTTSLLCYPSNPRGYFDLDLRDQQTRQHYEALGIRHLASVIDTNPFAVENHFNSLVYRDAEPRPSRPGVHRVVVVGDSFTEGWGVREPDTYPRVLERLLDRAEPGRWEVWNCGKANADFPQLLYDFERALALRPDIVVYGMVLNDPEMSPRLRARKPHALYNLLQPRDAPELGGSRLLMFVRNRLAERRTRGATIRWYLDLFTDENRRWKTTKDKIRQMDRMTRERGGSFLVAVWPMLLGIEGPYPFAAAHATIASFCDKSAVHHLDLLPALAGRSSASLCVHPVDMHPNEVAHRLVAERLEPVVRSLGPVSAFHEVNKSTSTPARDP